MKIIVAPNSLNFSGVLDENTSKTQLFSAVDSLRARDKSAPVPVDFTNVMYANSSGIMTWLQLIKKSEATLKYVNTPLWLVDHFNLLRGFFEFGSYAESVQAAYAAPETHESKIYTLTLGRDVPILQDYTDFKLPTKLDGDVVYEPDFLPKRHFAFISENYANFRAKIKG